MAPLLVIGRRAPNFKGVAIVNGCFKEMSLADFKNKYLVLFFYPSDFSFVCPSEIAALNARIEEFRDINCEIVACSTDSRFSHLAWIGLPKIEGGLGKIGIPMLSDKNLSIAKSFGIFDRENGVSYRGHFIIDGESIVRQISINDTQVGRSVDELLRVVKCYQKNTPGLDIGDGGIAGQEQMSNHVYYHAQENAFDNLNLFDGIY